MRSFKISAIFLVSVLLSACASTKGPHEGFHRGSVVMKTGTHEAHVCMGRQSVQIGDKVVAYRNDCRTKVTGGSRASSAQTVCTKVSKGTGKVTHVYSDDYSVVEFEPDVEFAEGDIVERAQK